MLLPSPISEWESLLDLVKRRSSAQILITPQTSLKIRGVIREQVKHRYNCQ